MKKTSEFALLRLRRKIVRFENEQQGQGAETCLSADLLHVSDTKKQAAWLDDLLRNLACAFLITASISVFCMCINEPLLTLCALSCAAAFMAVTSAELFKPRVAEPGPEAGVDMGRGRKFRIHASGRRFRRLHNGRVTARVMMAAAIAAVLLLILIIWHSAVLGGLAMLINSFYTAAEEAQAYIYDRLPGGDYASAVQGRIGFAWLSCLIGTLAALPPKKYRRIVAAAVSAALMLALAYYGLLPAAACIAVVLVSLVVCMSRGGVIPAAPVVLAVLLLFGVLVLADPGENMGISRADENFRDRFAIRTALLETADDMYDDEEDEDSEEEDFEDEEDEDDEEEEDSGFEAGTVAAAGAVIAVIAAIGAAAYMVHRRLARKRAANRRGIKSTDPRTAVTAMFPYSVRWLAGLGIELPQPAFKSIIPSLEKEFDDAYSRRFEEMYDIWSEAAYSDHSISEENRGRMETFMNDTMEMVKQKCKLRDKLRIRFRHAL